MDDDLQTLLAAWTGGEFDPARADVLLARLRSDAAFRHAFVAEIHLLGRLKAVQSPEPRWLSLLDALGTLPPGGAAEHDAEFESRLMERIERDAAGSPASPGRFLPPARRNRLEGPAMALLVLFVAAGLWLFLTPPRWALTPPPELAGVEPPPQKLALVVQADGVEWAKDSPKYSVGDFLPSGRAALARGRLILAFPIGATLAVEGEADFDLQSRDRVFIRRGRLRARIEPGGEGFVVSTPNCAVVDLGTEFGFDVAADGRANLDVYEGQAEISVLGRDGKTVRSELVSPVAGAEVDPKTKRIESRPPAPAVIASVKAKDPPKLSLKPNYASEVLRDRPWGYWRFEPAPVGAPASPAPSPAPAVDGKPASPTPPSAWGNALAGKPALQPFGPARIAAERDGNHAVVFPEGPEGVHLALDDLFSAAPSGDYAFEFWFLSDAYRSATVVNLHEPSPTAEPCHLVLELTSRAKELVHEAGAVRFLHRWPPGDSGGVNLFSKRAYSPQKWGHLVAQRAGNRFELYMDGAPAVVTEADERDLTAPAQLMVGRLRSRPNKNPGQIRQFVGRLDELALYSHALPPARIKLHASLGKQSAK